MPRRFPLPAVLIAASVACFSSAEARLVERTLILKIDESGVCYVRDEEHLRSLGERGPVQPPGRYDDELMDGPSIGPCLPSEGLFQYRGSRSIYYVGDGKACLVEARGQLRAMGGRSRINWLEPGIHLPGTEQKPESCAWPDGFYRARFGQSVYRLKDGEACRISDLRQLEMLGDEQQVIEVRNENQVLGDNRDPRPCPLPDGFYRARFGDGVYRIEEGMACRVSGERHLRVLGGDRRVVEVEDARAVVGSGSEPLACPWPDGFYRASSGGAMFRMEDGVACRITGEQHLGLLAGGRPVTEVGDGPVVAGDAHSIDACGWPDGFYQPRGGRHIYRVIDGRSCWVTSPQQLGLLGGSRRVVRVAGESGIVQRGRALRACNWPDGFYQVAGRPEVYHVNDGRLCHVPSPRKLAAMGGTGKIRRVNRGAGLLFGNESPRRCR